jgi:ubiquinone/menaquinone biosynthesis C-methylase UbiE
VSGQQLPVRSSAYNELESALESTDYLSVTELSGTEVSREQVDRISHRYAWAGTYCAGKDVVEVACGTGQGLGYLSGIARSIEAGDVSQAIVDLADAHYGDRIKIRCFDARKMPWEDASKDIVLIFEAIYYLESFPEFLDECLRVLRPGGMVLIATANKDLSDFNPSPHSHTYYGVVELESALGSRGFSSACYGYMAVIETSTRQRILSPIKKLAVNLGLMPKTMAGKKLLKKLVFGGLVHMPAEIGEQHLRSYAPPDKLENVKNTTHKVIYCAAKKRS